MMNMKREPIHSAGLAAAVMLVAGVTGVAVAADDWTNSGGNAARNGRTSEIGPDNVADLAWTYTARSAIHACQPVIEGSRVFVVRDAANPPEPPEGTSSPVVAIDLDTGVELWHTYIPFASGDWSTWVAGVKNGLVFACRGDTLHTHAYAPVVALHVADGSVAWTSQEEIDAGPYGGVVFADNGDLIIGSFRAITRIRWTDGTTVWTAEREGAVAADCGVAVFGNGVYISDYAYDDGGHIGAKIVKFDLATGAKMYEAPPMIGGHSGNMPMCGPDGAIYFAMTQNYPPLDKFYSFSDTGTALVENWRVPAGWSSDSEFGVGPDGSVYMIGPGSVIQRLNPVNGAVISSSLSAIPFDTFAMIARFAIDGDGKVFFCNGATTNGRLYSFNADLTERWSVSVPFATIGGPAIGPNGTLVQVGRLNVRAWRTDRVVCAADLNGDGIVDFSDYLEFLNLFDAMDPRADFNHDDLVDFSDYLEFLNLYDAGC